jgi:hypothetical protein
MTIEDLKWQIHAETALTQIMQWLIVALLVNHWIMWVVCVIMTLGNLYVARKAVSHLSRDYLKD